MGLFGLFNNKEKKEDAQNALPWQMLSSLEQLDQIEMESKVHTVLIFKHSTRCGISRMVLRQFEGAYDEETADVSLYFLDLLAYREVSNEVSIKFQVLHQSPQLLVIKNGVAVQHASHYQITTLNYA